MPHTLTPHIDVRNLDKTYKNKSVLKKVCLDFFEGELTAVIGRSGCGKSTLLKCLNGLERIDSGSIRVGNVFLDRNADQKHEERTSALRRNFGMVFQGFNLFPHLTILENLIKAPMVVKKLRRSEASAIAIPLLEKVGLLSHIDYYPSQLSGGQQQRAAIARALAMAPKVMLYDEPTSALDPWLSDEVFAVMRQIAAERMTQIVVTHELRFVREFADKVIFIEDGEVVEIGSPTELFEAPQDERTRRFLKR